MWFLWSLITFLVVIFSTSQIVSYVVCFLKYPEMMVNIPTSNKKMIIGGLLLHSCINIAWIVLVCVIPMIREHWIAILIVSVISIFIGIYGVKSDFNLKKNFANLTGYDRRCKLEDEIDQLMKKYDIKIDEAEEVEEESINDMSEQQKEILKEIEDSEISYEQAQEFSERAEEHSIDKIPYYAKRVKEDKKYINDIAEILLRMYGDDTQVHLAIDNVVLCVEHLSDKYLIVFTDNDLIAERYKGKEKPLGFRDTLELFYEFNRQGACQGIIFNPFTDSQLIFPKESIDNIHLELFYDVPWKKK